MREESWKKAWRACLTLGAFLSFFPSSPGSTASDTYDWFEGAEGYEEVLAKAKEGDRPFLLLFSVDWCPYCKELEKEYLNVSPSEDIINENLRVIINPEKGEKERKIADAYGAKRYPHFLVLYPGQEKPSRIKPYGDSGALTSDQFAEVVRKALAWSHCTRGVGFWEGKEYRKSLPYFARALAVYPAYPWGHYGLGKTWVRLGIEGQDAALLQRGEDCLQKALALKPGYEDAQLELAYAREHLAKLNAAGVPPGR